MSSTDPTAPKDPNQEAPGASAPGPPPFRPPGVPPFIPAATGPGMPLHRPPWGPPGMVPGGIAPPPWMAAAHGQAFPRPAAPQPRPISSKPIPGTDWLEVRNDNGTRFWHNTKTGQGLWQMPAEVRAAGRAPPPLDAARAKMLQRAVASGAVVAPQYEAMARRQIKGQLLLEAGPGDKKRSKKRSAETQAAPGTGASIPENQFSNENEEEEDEFDVTFTEEDIIGEEQPPPLSETAPAVGGTPAATKEEQRPSSVAAANVAAAQTAAEDAFRALLTESGIHGFSRYEREAPKLQGDPRFSALPPDHRRTVFEDFCSQVGMVKKSTDKGKKKQQPGASKTGLDAKNKSTTGGGTAGGGGKNAKAAEDAFRALLQERVVRSDARWHRTKEDLRSDPRYQEVESSDRREDLFRAHVDSLWKVQEARERAERRARNEYHAADERKRQAGAADAAHNFCALLAEAVRDPASDWSETWEILKRDPQGRATHPLLDTYTAERVFKDHIASLAEAASSGFTELLQENRALLPLSEEWAVAESEIEAAVGNDPRFHKLPANLRAGAWQYFRRQGLSNDEEKREVALDPAYARAYLEKDAKRPRIE